MKHFILLFFAGMIFFSKQVNSQVTDSAAMVKSQDRIESNLKDAKQHQRKIDKSQRKIEKQQRKINRQERKRERKMKKIEKEQKKSDKD